MNRWESQAGLQLGTAGLQLAHRVRPGPPAARGMAAIGALIACAAAATGLAPSLHLASLGMPRAATSGVPPAASRLPGGSSSLEET